VREWVIEDRHGRQQRVRFADDPTSQYGVGQSVNLPPSVPPSTTCSCAPQTLRAPCTRPDVLPVTTNTPLLDWVALPDGTTYRMEYEPSDCFFQGSLKTSSCLPEDTSPGRMGRNAGGANWIGLSHFVPAVGNAALWTPTVTAGDLDLLRRPVRSHRLIGRTGRDLLSGRGGPAEARLPLPRR
jgi:hypothetical protein